MSSFSKDPYSIISKDKRLTYQDEVAQLVKLGRSHQDLNMLIKFAKLRKTSNLVLQDSNLLKIINPSTSYNNQPSHSFIQYLGLKDITSIIATEPFIWAIIDNKGYTGHIDLLQIIGKKIRILDYKPDLSINFNSEKLTGSIIDGLPQVASYGILLDLVFKLRDLGFEFECGIFNENGYCLFDPYVILKSSVDFYYRETKELPEWAALLPQGIIDEILGKYLK